MVDFLKIIDFGKDIKETPELQDHIKRAADELSIQHRNDENYQKPALDTDLSNIVIITGLPEVPQDKVDKLEGFLKGKIFPALEIPVPEINFSIQNGTMLGMALLTFSDADVAKNAASKLNTYQFDKAHVLSACTNSEFDEIVKLEDKYHTPEFVPMDELQAWLFDSRFREQLLVRVQDRHYLQWFDHIAKAESLFSGNTFETEEYGEVIKFEWSRNGSYLVTFHDEGFCLWGGKDFKRLNFYSHSDVTHVDFSPDETYVLSFNGTAGDVKSSENYIVWRVGTVEKLRSFKAGQTETWGSYKWNYDGKFLASYGNDLLNIYELPSMSRVTDPATQKKSPIKVPNIQNIEWAPNKNLLCIAAFKPQGATKGESGKIYVMEFPSRQQLKWKTITWEFNSCDIYWENTGNKIILALKKVIKNKKTSVVVQIGEIKQNTIIVEEHEFLDGKIVNVDDSGKRVAVLSLEAQQKESQGALAGYTIELFKTDEEIRGKYFQKLGTLVDKHVSHVQWSPNGTFFALVNTDKLSAKIGFLEFGLIKGNTIEIIKSTKFQYMIQSAWDPSGRYLTTSSFKGQYTIWTAFGDAIIKDNFTEITQIEWRPKPKVILPATEEGKLSSDLKKYTKKFEEEDDKIVNAKEHEKRRLRKEQKEEFEKLLQKKKRDWEETRQERIRLLGFDEDHPTDIAYDEIVEGEEPADNKK